MSTTQKIIKITSVLFALITLYCLIAFKLGSTSLLLIGDISIHPVMMEIIKYVVYTIHAIMYFSYVLNWYNRKIFALVALYMPMLIATEQLLFSGLFTSVILPIIFLSLFALSQKIPGVVFKRLLIINIVMAGYQACSLLVKVGYGYLGYNTLNAYQWFISSIDLLLLMLVFYAKGGEQYYVGSVVWRKRNKWELLVFPETCETPKSDSEDNLEIDEFRKLEGFKRMKALSLLLIFQLIQLTIIIFICHVGNIFIEGLVITTAFIAYGFVIKRRWHSKSLIICTLSSVALFYTAAKITVAFKYSQFVPILTGLAIVYSLYRFSIFLDTVALKKVSEERERLSKLEAELEKINAHIDKFY